jgi:HlyD family type I secretion membrane fusion protein
MSTHPAPLSGVIRHYRARWCRARERLAGLCRRATGRFAAASSPETSLSAALAPWRRLGWAIVMAGLGGALLWAATAPLDGAAVASGVVAVESKRKTIQHLEGGIIREIVAAEGARVAAGDVLIRFDGTQPRATLALLHGRLAAALALRARLVAERDGRDEIDFPDELMAQASDPAIARIMVGEVDVMNARRSRIQGQESVLRERIDKQHQEIAGLRAKIAASRQQLALLDEEIGPHEEMAARGVISRSSLLALKGKRADLVGSIGDYQAQIARAEDGISEVQLQLKMPRTTDHNQVTEDLQTVQADIADLRDKIGAAEDVLRRTEVVAPVSGTVVDLQVHTEGGVVQPGQRLLDVVPDRDRLVVDVRVDPRDIDVVYPGMPAQVRLTAFNARTTPTVPGTLNAVSADRMSDEVTGAPYFSAQVVLDEARSALDPRRLKAGMQAEVFLVTSERSALDYLVEPLIRSFNRAGREQ